MHGSNNALTEVVLKCSHSCGPTLVNYALMFVGTKFETRAPNDPLTSRM